MTDKDDRDKKATYEVGYGRPPKGHQFKKGQSGNPRGRTKGQKNLRTHLAEELEETIAITENGRLKKISKGRGMVKALAAKALRGDVRAIIALASLTERHVLSGEGASKSLPLAEEDNLILELFARSRSS